MEEKQLENSKIPKQLLPHVYKKGQCGNPNGRPKGAVSLKTYAKRMLENMTDEEREDFLQGLPKQFIWEMAEGKAKQDTETKMEITLPQPIIPLDNVQGNNSNETDNSTE